jgi:hypothetical protein
MIGAHTFVERYTPPHEYTRRAHPPCTYLSSSIKFGNKVDMYLEQFVDQGWLDLSYACDPLFEELIASGDKAATAAHDIRNELLRAGFVATESQVPALAFGMCPILDLIGYNRVGECVIVELKCGRSALDRSTNSGTMRSPFNTLKHNGYTKAMLQLAIQRTCLSSMRNVAPHAWLVTHAHSTTTSHIAIKNLPCAISELVESHLVCFNK